MRTKLLPHNKTAYKKVTDALATSDRTCVIHPTGTGKSYLIAAVSESYRKVLILGPNRFVLGQVHDVLKWRKHGVEYMTYKMATLTESPHTDYDLICLDEFHRAGAPEWGDAVIRLLEMNTGAKVLGTTATNIRYLDDERDMADELFHGNIASHITIAEAWSRSILPIPRYVSGLFRWDKTFSETKERINRSRRIGKEEKRERIFRLTNARLHWEKSYGMPAILRRHLDHDARRIIVFCSSIERLDQMRQETVGWFREAGFAIADTCIMHSGLTVAAQHEQMRSFESNAGDGVKLMFSVDMLNEGIHVPNVSAVIMLRTTASRIVYLQQMGRCLTAANSEKPIVLDMVDNITTTTAVKDVADEFNALEIPLAEREGREPRRFEIHDYTLGVKELIDRLVPGAPEQIPFEERLAMATAFCEKHGRVPGKRDERKESSNWHILIHKYKGEPEVTALRNKYSTFFAIPKEERMRRFADFCEKNNRLPARKDGEEYKNYEALMNVCHDEIRPYQEKFGKFKTFAQRFEQLRRFVEANDRFPSELDGSQEYCNYRALRRCHRHTSSQELHALIVKYDPRTLEEVKQALLEYCAEFGRLPRNNVGTKRERMLYNRMARRRTELFKFPELAAMRVREPILPIEKKIEKMQEFVARHGRKPLMSEKGRRTWNLMVQQGKDDPRVKELVEACSDDPKVNMRRYIGPLADFVRREQRAPSTMKGKEERYLYNIYSHIRSKYADHPDVAALLAEIARAEASRKHPIDILLDEVEAFAEENGRLPSVSKKSGSEERRLACNWYNFAKRKYGHLPRVKELMARYPRKHT